MRYALWIVMLAAALAAAGCAGTGAKRSGGEGQAGGQKAVEEALALGDRALGAGDHEHALVYYVQALEHNPDSPEALLRIGRVHLMQGTLEPAERALRKLLEIDREHAAGWEAMGLVELNKKQYTEAEQSLQTALKFDTRRWAAYNGLGVIADMRGDYKQAQRHYEAGLGLQPNSVQLLNNLGYSHYLAGQWSDAEKAYASVVAIDPQHKKVWYNLALVYVRQQDYERARAALLKVMAEPQAYNTLGTLVMREGAYRPAETYFKEALRLSPSFYVAAAENLKLSQARQAAPSLPAPPPPQSAPAPADTGRLDADSSRGAEGASAQDAAAVVLEGSQRGAAPKTNDLKEDHNGMDAQRAAGRDPHLVSAAIDKNYRRMEKLQQDRSALLVKYTHSHPDVLAIERMLAELQHKIQQDESALFAGSSGAGSPAGASAALRFSDGE